MDNGENNNLGENYQVSGNLPVEKLEDTDRLLCALSYPLAIIAVVILLTKKDSKTCMLHAYNALGLAVAAVVAGFALSILSFVFSFLPVLGCVIILAGSLLGLIYFVYAVVLAFKVYQGEIPEIPYVTAYINNNLMK